MREITVRLSDEMVEEIRDAALDEADDEAADFVDRLAHRFYDEVDTTEELGSASAADDLSDYIEVLIRRGLRDSR